MKTSSFFLSTLIAAAAMSASAYGADFGTDLTDSTAGISLSENMAYDVNGQAQTLFAENATVSFVNDVVLNIAQNANGSVTKTFQSGTSITGKGQIWLWSANANSDYRTTWNLSGVNAEDFSGVLGVGQIADKSIASGTNQNGGAELKISGEQWTNTEIRLVKNSTNNPSILTLVEATTIAGISDSSAQFTSSGFSEDGNAKTQFGQISASAGTILTFSGSGNYTFSGNIGRDGEAIEINMTGTGTQVLRGTNYLTSVSVGENATLDLSGSTTTITEAISNAGTVLVSSETVFALVSSSASDGVYSVINNSGNGTVDGWDSTTLGLSNFTIDGNALSKRLTLNLSGAGQVSITGTVASLVWNGGNSGTWDVETTQNWTNEGVADVFYSYDNVTFGTEATRKTVSINGDVVAGTVSIEDDYTFSATKNTTLSSTGISVASGKTLTLSAASDTVLTITGATTGGANLVKSGSGTVNIANTGNDFSSVSAEEGLLEFGGTVGKIKTLNVKSGATLSVVAGNDLVFWSNGHENNVYNIEGTLNLNTTRLSIDRGKFSLSGGTISGTGDGQGALDFYGPSQTTTIDVSGVSTVSATIRVRNEDAVTIADFVVAEGSTLNFSGEKIGGGTMKKSGSGTMNFSGTISAGTLEVAAGAVNFSGTIGENGVVSVSKEAVLDYGKGTSSLSTSRVKGFGTIKYEFFKDNATTGTGSGLTTSADFSGTVDYTGCLNWTSGSGANIAQTVTIANDATTLRLSSVEEATSIMWGRGEKTLSNKIVFATNYGVGLGAGSLTLAGEVDAVGKTITISGGNNFCIGGNATIGALSGGNTKITAGGVLTLGQGVDAGADILSGSLNVANGGNVKLVGLLVSGVITAEEGAMVRIAVQNVNANEITLASGAKLAVDLADFASELATDADEVMLTILTGTTLRFGDVSAASSDILTSENLSYLSIEDSSGEFLDKYAGQKWSYDGSTLSLSLTIPEPSAFGLLAGVGALALVASRRRRK